MFNEAMTIEAVLEDAGYVADRSGRYIRPGGERSSVIILDNRSIHFNPSDPLYSESPNGGHHAQAPFSAWCLLNHSNDFRPAIRAAAELLHLDDFTIASDEQHTATAGTMLEEPYFDHDGQFWMRQYERDGSEKNPLLLCNFTAQIIAELQLDDGEQQEERYIIQATCRGRSKTIDLARVDFESENAVGRIVAKLGARARVNPRAQFRYILDAIKAFSTTVEEKVTYTHTGWAGERYLFGNGYVDANGWHETNGAQLPLRLKNYEIAPHGDMAAALQLFDDLLKLAPPEVMVPLIGGILLAPIHESIDAPAPMIHVYGPTGSYKTSMSCAAMALWGNFTPAQPTDTWTSTGYSVQRLGWYLKDAPMLLDDYKAANVQPKQVIFLLQNYGDNMARGRLDANSDLRNLYPMRCVLLSSGEDQPEGEASTLARILSVPVARHDVDRKRLTIIQEQAELLSCVTVAYLTWIAAQRPALDHVSLHRTVRTELLAALEQGVTQQINPGRVASNAATIYTSWSCFCRFLTEQGHWSQARTDQWLRECKRGLLQLARAQLNLTAQERYSQLFLEAVRSLVASQRAVIMNIAQASPMLDSGQVLLGAADQHGTYLITGAAYDEVCKHLRSVGRPVSFSKRALAQMLHQDGLLLSVENGFDMKKRFGDGQRPRCWHLPADILDG